MKRAASILTTMRRWGKDNCQEKRRCREEETISWLLPSAPNPRGLYSNKITVYYKPDSDRM